jgi:hypothetical protein
MSQSEPWNLLNIRAMQVKQPVGEVGNPQIPIGVAGDASHDDAGNAINGNESVVLQVPEASNRRDSNSTTLILIKRMRFMPIKFPVWFVAAGRALAVRRKLPVLPSLQTI